MRNRARKAVIMRKACQFVLVASVGMFVASLARAELAKKSEPIKSLSCGKKVSLKFEQYTGAVQVSSEGTVEYARANDGKDCYHAEEVVTTKGEALETSNEKLTTVSDGVLTRVVSSTVTSSQEETNETTMSSDLLVVQQIVGKGILSSIEARFKPLKIVESKLGAEEVCIIEAEPKEDASFTAPMGPLARAKFIIARKNAVLLKIIHLDSAGREFGKTEFTAHKINPTINAARFKTGG
jgi:outer membrane lipoprotein-sorting protein